MIQNDMKCHKMTWNNIMLWNDIMTWNNIMKQNDIMIWNNNTPFEKLLIYEADL